MADIVLFAARQMPCYAAGVIEIFLQDAEFYTQGVEDGIDTERAMIVAWLRFTANMPDIADRIEAGEHSPNEDEEP
ncbi:MAG: hypothetical protein KGP14_15680 [Betaproteobacteria bacterium]|nr:hypothetical protein [Betaproteobacteria bacterium]